MDIFLNCLTKKYILLIMEGTIGEIRMFAGTFAPRTWAYCDGRIINIASNTALFSILGATYGGNGTTTFALPDLRGRTAVGAGSGPGLSPYALGQKGGVETGSISMQQMPIHTHVIGGNISTNPVAIPALNDSATSTEPSNVNFPALSEGATVYEATATPNAFMGNFTTSLSVTNTVVTAVGAGAPFSIQPPIAATNYIICLVGIFPARD